MIQHSSVSHREREVVLLRNDGPVCRMHGFFLPALSEERGGEERECPCATGLCRWCQKCLIHSTFSPQEHSWPWLRYCLPGRSSHRRLNTGGLADKVRFLLMLTRLYGRLLRNASKDANVMGRAHGDADSRGRKEGQTAPYNTA